MCWNVLEEACYVCSRPSPLFSWTRVSWEKLKNGTQQGSRPAEGTSKLNSVPHVQRRDGFLSPKRKHQLKLPHHWALGHSKKKKALCNRQSFREQMGCLYSPAAPLWFPMLYFTGKFSFLPAVVDVNIWWGKKGGTFPTFCPIMPEYSPLPRAGTLWEWKCSVMTPNPPHKAIGWNSSPAYGSEVGGGWTQRGCRLHSVPWGQIKAYGSSLMDLPPSCFRALCSQHKW